MPNFCPEDPHASFIGEDYAGYEVPPDVHTTECIEGADFKACESSGNDRAASVDFEVPIANTLFFLSRGQSSVGEIKATSSPKQPPGSANVKIIARYALEEVRNQIRVFLLNGGEGSNGFGVFTPRSGSRSPPYGISIVTLHFDITITFPEGTEDQPFTIPNFQSDASGMTHEFSKLTKVTFADIRISSNNHSISVEFLRAARGEIKTTNAPIRGEFESTGEIQLRTSNAPINIKATLRSGEDGTTLAAKTSNGNLTAYIHASGKPGSFDVHAKTSNAPIKVNFEEAPPSSVVRLSAGTSNAPATVSLPPTFDGEFIATTTAFSRAAVKSVGGRKIRLRMPKSPHENHAEGRVGGTQDGCVGKVDVWTTSADAAIYLK